MMAKQLLAIRRQVTSRMGQTFLEKIVFRPFPSQLKPGFKKLLEGRNALRDEYLRHTEKGGHERRDFSLDGRLVGDLGELVAAMISEIVLTKGTGAQFDGHLKDQPHKQVQVRCSLRDDSIAIKHGKGHFIAIQLREESEGQFRVVYDGPALRPWIYVNADKKSGKRNPEREADTKTLKQIKLTTWAILNEDAQERFVTA